MADDGSIALPQTLTLDHVSPATRLLEKRRQMFEVQEALDAQKEEFARREEAFRRREEGLRKKDLDLQESLIRFNKFLQENESKRTRAEKRANDEFKERVGHEARLADQQQQLKDQRAELMRKERELKDLKKYEDFLMRVLDEHGDDYQEIPSVVARYQTLQRANKEMEERQKETEESNEAKRDGYFMLKTKLQQGLLRGNTEINELKKELERVEIQTLEYQKEVDARTEAHRDRLWELGRVLMAVDNVEARCTRNPITSVKGTPVIKHTESSSAEAANGGSNGAGGAGGKPPEKEAEGGDDEFDIAKATPAQIAARGARALGQLDVIKEYIKDFAWIKLQYLAGGGDAVDDAGAGPTSASAAGAAAGSAAATGEGGGKPPRPAGSASDSRA